MRGLAAFVVALVVLACIAASCSSTPGRLLRWLECCLGGLDDVGEDCGFDCLASAGGESLCFDECDEFLHDRYRRAPGWDADDS